MVAGIEGVETIVPLSDAAASDPAVVGAKAANLNRLARKGFPVPDGFVIPVGACARAAVDDEHAALVNAEAARAVAGLRGRPVAVRSSAVGEDASEASFAGQHCSVLGVRGGPELTAAINAVLASAVGPALDEYRHRIAGGSQQGMAVLVQHQIDADAAGVAFTADPVTGDRDRVLVSAVRGLGDRLASGAATPEEWIVRESEAVRLTPGDEPVLTAAQAREVAQLAKRVETTTGVPHDIEWAIARDAVHLLQARPITALPTPPDVDLAAGSWIKESGRRAELLTPFGASVVLPIVTDGLAIGFAKAGSLIERIEQRFVGGEVYLRLVPAGGPRAAQGPPPPWWLLGLLARVAPPLRTRCRAARHACRPGAIDEFVAHWQAERPKVIEASRRLRELDLTTMSDAELDAHLSATIELLRSGLAIHFEVIPPYVRAVYDLVTTCRELLGYDDAAVFELLAGTSVTSSEPARALAEVAAHVQDPARVRALLLSASADARERLAEVDAPTAAAFDAWRDTFAWRVLGEDPGAPTLAEQPAMLAMVLLEALEVRDALDGQAGEVDGRRAAAIERARVALDDRPTGDRARFDSALELAARIYPAREDTAVWAACHPGGLVRRAALEAGRRFADAGVLARADDVTLLHVETVHAALGGGRREGVRAEAAKARAERAWVAAHPGPRLYGSPPSPPPDFRGLPAAARRMNEALMWSQNHQHTKPKPAGQDGELHGAPASPGRHTGPVRIVREFRDFDRIQPGDVVVCPAADPSWSVMFGAIGAVVTEAGGALSHVGIVAREHGVPAVVAVNGATRLLSDGQLVIVDGAAGSVTPASSSATSASTAT